jgi:hypothetical protein
MFVKLILEWWLELLETCGKHKASESYTQSQIDVKIELKRMDGDGAKSQLDTLLRRCNEAPGISNSLNINSF